MRFRLLFAVLLLAPFGMTPAPAQPTPRPADAPAKEIVVTGRNRTARQQVRAATQAVSRPVEGQIARFSDPICPQAQGLPDEYDRIIEARIRRQADALGIAQAKPGCRPNILVIMVENGQALLRNLKQRTPAAFDRLAGDKGQQLLDQPGPVHVVNLTETRGSQGERFGPGADLVGSSLQGARSMVIHEASIINMTTRQDISGALVIIDTPALVGKSMKQIGDYAMMRTLARTDAGKGRGPVASILGLFDDAGAPAPELTGFDRAYLQALYHGPANRPAGAMLGEITSSVNRHYQPEPTKP